MGHWRKGYGLRINDARINTGLSQIDLAALLGVEQPQISRWEQERHAPRVAMFHRIAAILKVHPNWLQWGPDSLQANDAVEYVPTTYVVRELFGREAELAALSVPGPKRGNPRSG